MNLSSLLSDELNRRGVKYSTVALDDNFAVCSVEGQNAYQMANVDCDTASQELMRIMNNV